MKSFQALLLFLVLLPAVARAQFLFTTSNGAISITGYRGTNGMAIIPDTINGSSVVRIAFNAFNPLYGNFPVTNAAIPNSVTNIDVGAFQNCANLTNLILGSGIISINLSAFEGCSRVTSVTIPNSVTSLGDTAFKGCSNLTSLTLGSSLVTIGTQAFAICGSLTNIAIPSTTTNIAPYAFYYCTNVAAITVAALNPVYSSADGVLFDKVQTTLLQYPGARAGSYAIPTNVTSIGNGFWNCVRLTGVSIPGSVTNMSYGPFSGCTSLTNIAVAGQNPVCSVVVGVLFDKTQTTLLQFPGGQTGSYTIPGGVTSIDALAFSYCSQLTSVTVPASVSSLGNAAFEACMNLTGIFFQGDAPVNLGTYVFYPDENATAYYLPGTAGWGSTFGGLPTTPWLLPSPLILNNGPGFGVQSNTFGFTVSWATNAAVVVEACTDLANPVWQPLQTNTLGGGSFYFCDAAWADYPERFYRLRSP